MPPKNVYLKPLTKEAFTSFGDVIEAEGTPSFSINAGAINRYHKLATVETDDDGEAIISIVSCKTVTELPYQLKRIERHPKGSQAFIPLNQTPMIIVVAEVNKTNEINALHGFVTNGAQGINYRRGVWHMPLIATVKGLKYLVVDRNGEDSNCDEINFKHQQIYIQPPNIN